MPIRNYSILNFEFTIQNSKLKIAKGNNSKLKTQNFQRQQLKIQNSKLKIAKGNNSKFKTQNCQRQQFKIQNSKIKTQIWQI